MSTMNRLESEMYYVKEQRDTGMHRIGTVTLIKDEGGKYHRGISILPVGEIFNSAYMIGLSQERALRAMGTKKSDLQIVLVGRLGKGKESVLRFGKALNKMGIEYPSRMIYKSGYDVALCAFEKSIFKHTEGG